jgi:transposase
METQPSNKKLLNTGPDKSVQELEREVKRLKKQLKRAQLENDILKKADEYFVKHGK